MQLLSVFHDRELSRRKDDLVRCIPFATEIMSAAGLSADFVKYLRMFLAVFCGSLVVAGEKCKLSV